MSDRPENQGKEFDAGSPPPEQGGAGRDESSQSPKPERIWPPPEPEPQAPTEQPLPESEPEPELIDLDWDEGVEKLDDMIEEIRQLNGQSAGEERDIGPTPPARPTSASEGERHRPAASAAADSRAPAKAHRGVTGTLSRRVRPRSEGEMAQLWSNVFLSVEPPPPRSIIVTSARRGDGATQIAAALALVGADANRELSVALVDFNLRQPDLADQLGIANELGVTDVLASGSSIDSAVQALSLKGGAVLHVLPAGTTTDQPLGVIKSRQFRAMIAALKERFDRVIIDVACAGIYPDAQVIGSLVDGALLVVRAGATARETVAEAKKRLDYAGVKCLGIVLNQRNDPIPSLVYRMT